MFFESQKKCKLVQTTKTGNNKIMNSILIIGAGRSASYLIKYLVEKSKTENFHLTIADKTEEEAKKYTPDNSSIKTVSIDLEDKKSRRALIQNHDLVISMLPASLHIPVAKDCLRTKKHLVTASYASPEMKDLHEKVKDEKLIFMNECGLDPGIDHMSAMKVIEKIRREGGKIILFESFCGGLVAPEHDDNLWNYKFTWNPRNVVLAGQGPAAKFIQQGKFKYIPYTRLFRRTEFFQIDGFGKFEAYANRNSLHYKEAYGLKDALTVFRGTVRRPGFSRAWNVFVQLGMTDDSYKIEHSQGLSYREFVNLFLPYHPTDSVEVKLRLMLDIQQDDVIWEKLVELDLFNPDKIIPLDKATPAQVLEHIVSQSWNLKSDEKDMVVMYHMIGYEINGKKKQIDATMVALGENRSDTAMAKTVGLPVGIIALQILKGDISTYGVQIPTTSEVYEPTLKELEKHNVHFYEKEVHYRGY